MAEVDKFKRRVIRAVARLLRRDQTPGEEMWKALQNEAGCDCKLLWQRMRALTLKKMKRLILAEDRLDNIAAVAKMTLTDWLLFDLVLVHEDIDVIGQDLKTEPTILTDLFNVVKRFQIEGKQGEALATAWTAATFFYNSFGRQCSPMLLQRRWYQLKKLTRSKFYNFWFQYRGNARLLDNAKEFQPTKLQSDIAKSFPYLVTKPFCEWDKMIKEKLIILPEEFEAKIKKKNPKSKPATVNEPDLVLLEPQIETIDLGVDSEVEGALQPADETSKDLNLTNTALNPVSLAAAIKSEPKDDFEMDFEDEFNAKDLEAAQIPDDDNAVDNSDYNAIEINDDNAVDSNDDNSVENTMQAGQSYSGDVIPDEAQEINAMPKICSVAGNFNQDSIPMESTDSGDNRNEVMDEINDILESAAEITKGTNVIDSSTKLHTSSKIDTIPVQSAAAAQSIDIDESDDHNEVMTEINNVLKSVTEVKKETCGPMQNDLAVQCIDIDESDDHNEVMTEINNVLKSASEVKKETRGTGLKSSSVRIGPKSVLMKRMQLEAQAMRDESVTQPMDIDESYKDALASSSRNEVMTEIDSILVSAIQEKSRNPTPVGDCKVTGTEEINESLDKINARDGRVTQVNLEFEDTDDNDEVEAITDIKVEETPLEDLKEKRSSVAETSLAEDIINDPSIDIPTDLTFEDDGIVLDDDGIVFEEDTNDEPEKIKVEPETGSGSSVELENIQEPAKFDLKLLMHPCVYTLKLEDMTVFRNRDIDNVRDKLSLEAALVESKMHVKHVKVEDEDIKDEQDYESLKSENVSDHDSDDSEDGIPENIKVKPSSYMLQKPKSRSYHPIQLCKNPDFNTRLKRLTVGFLSSNRNRLLLKCLKPMTIDLSKAFESKLINGTIYLKSDDGPKIKSERVIEVNDEPSVATAVMPSAMPVQSLIDNSSLNLQDLLSSPQKPPAKPYDLLFERQKTINLPDINNIRRLNQHLLTAEVTPMRTQPNDKHIPPVQLIAPSKANQMNASNAVVNSQLAHSELVSKSKDANTEAFSGLPTAFADRRKEYVRPNYNVTWNSLKKRPAKPSQDDELLLTLDTLNKMLRLFNEDGKEKPKIGKRKRMLVKERMELQKRMDQFEKKIGEVSECEPGDEADVQEVIPEKEKKKEEPPPEVVTPKINIVTDKPYGPYCCWARNKIEIEGKKAIRAHKCPRICRCCCRDELAQKLSQANKSRTPVTNPSTIEPRTPNATPSTIVISDDEETKKVNESIETVVSQSENVKLSIKPIKSYVKTTGMTYIENRARIRTEVSTQCDMGPESDFGKMNLPTVVSSRPDTRNKPEVITISDDVSGDTHTKTQRPVRVRKDLLFKPTHRSTVLPVSPVKHQGHITIDASKQKVQIHSDPVYFKSHGKEKILYMNNLQKTKDLTSPIFLGENKILLTDVKFPGSSFGNNKLSVIPSTSVPALAPIAPVPAAPVPSVQAATPTVPCTVPMMLPAGVQIILLPDGQLTYTIDPNIKLTQEEQDSLPTILVAIKEQLNQTTATDSQIINLTDESDKGTTTTDNEMIKLTDEVGKDAPTAAVDTTREDHVVSSDISTSLGETSNLDMVANADEGSGDEATNEKDKLNTNVALTNNKNATESSENSNENNIQDIHVENQIEENAMNVDSENIPLSTDNTETTENAPSQEINDELPVSDNTALVASDEIPKSIDTEKQDTIEGTAVAPENKSETQTDPTNSTGSSNRKTLLSDLMEMSGIYEEDIQTNVPTINENITMQSDLVPEASVLNNSNTVPDVPTVPSMVSITPRVTAGPMPSIPELTPITSFSQLKYACEHNGRFFKLDLILGTLTKISVCIKKNKPKPALHMLQKSVIDLTEDQDASPAEVAKPAKKRQTNKKQNIPAVDELDEKSLPAHVIRTNQDVITLNEEIIPATVIQTNRSLLKSNNPPDDTVKPLKLFRAIRILKRNQKDTDSVPLNVSADLDNTFEKQGTVAVNIKRKRKQELDIPHLDSVDSVPLNVSVDLDNTFEKQEIVAVNFKRQRKQELDKPHLDNDSSIEEVPVQEDVDDVSLDSSELDQYIWKDNESVSSGDSDMSGDTSDDEPLASKAKRMRANEHQQESSGSELNNKAAVPPENVTVVEKNNLQVACEIEMVNIQRLPSEEEITRQAGARQTGVTEEDVNEDAEAQENADSQRMDVPEDADAEEADEVAGVEEVPIEGDLNLVPALQAMESMDEDDDDGDCILGF